VLPDAHAVSCLHLAHQGALPSSATARASLTRLLRGPCGRHAAHGEVTAVRRHDHRARVNSLSSQIEERVLATDWCGGHFVIELTATGSWMRSCAGRGARGLLGCSGLMGAPSDSLRASRTPSASRRASSSIRGTLERSMARPSGDRQGDPDRVSTMARDARSRSLSPSQHEL